MKKKLSLSSLFIIMLIVLCCPLFMVACGNDNSNIPIADKQSITGITFMSADFAYDGNEHSITVSGKIPNGVKVTYKNNVATEQGEYYATATLSGENYNTLVLNAKFVIYDSKVSSYQELTEALTNGGLILLNNDIEVDCGGNSAETHDIAVTTATTIVGDGHKLLAKNLPNKEYRFVKISASNCKVELKDLEIQYEDAKMIERKAGIYIQDTNNLSLILKNVNIDMNDYYAMQTSFGSSGLSINIEDSNFSAWAAFYNRSSGVTFNAKNSIFKGTNIHPSPGSSSNYFTTFILSEYVLLNDEEFILKNLSANNHFTLEDCEIIATVSKNENDEPIDTQQKLIDIRSPYNNTLILNDCKLTADGGFDKIISAYDSAYVADENKNDPNFVMDTNKVIIDNVDVTNEASIVEKYYDE